LDHKSARESLIKIFASGKIPQAFLFSGPKGIGKTSAARIVAKAVNCQERVKEQESKKAGEKDFEPCGECSTCHSITNGANLDVLEIDAASNRGIDDIRELRDKIRLAPSAAKYKVYIIDEVHMLTNEAFNALLKTLEEPPEHAIFILCTTAPEKLPETIISRCTRVNFKKASQEEIVKKLQFISAEEKFKLTEEDFKKISRAAAGSFRDAVKILEQAANSSVDEVVETLGEFQPEVFLNLLAEKKIKQSIEWLSGAVESGINLRIFSENLLGILRDCLLSSYGVETEIKSDQLLKNLDEIQLKKLIELFSRATLDLRNAVIPQLPLEMAVIEWSLWGGGKQEAGSESGSGKQRTEEATEGGKREVKEELKESKLSPEVSCPVSHLASPLQLAEILAKWPEVLEKVKPLNHSVQAFLKATRPLGLEEGFLTLEVFYKFHKDQLESDKCRRIVEDVCGEVYCSPVKVKLILGEKPKNVVAPAKAEMISPMAEEIKKTVEDLPSGEDLVKLAEEIFNNEKETIH